ncbi:ATP-binding protein [Aquabacterium lacunae]|uniref:ATP-binding protein n=1 Tax=Aquabacterium lacunae TaxID=2528630 RepID=A0A4Q9H4D9_9BURK|nr:ATP-binding protein [Aquabacterium lacunae]TBO31362.1 ATP-binding protein [Aquabacterium lacunae]
MPDTLAPSDLAAFVRRAERTLDLLDAWLSPALTEPDWRAAQAWRYRRRASGQRALEPIARLDPITYEDLLEIDTQKERFARNLAQFVAGRTANNVLLSGARGTGKSSLVKAGLHAHAHQGLRLIEVDKSDLIDLPDLVELVAARPERFIVFCDDLSFEEGEPGYKALKSVLDGTVAARGDNVLIVATSNRRHLLPEYHSDNRSYSRDADGELHPGEVVEEKISLSERFGLWVSFYPFSQDEYLAIVGQWLQHLGLSPEAIELARPEALVWAIERGSRSGRVAGQFARDFAGRQAAAGEGA